MPTRIIVTAEQDRYARYLFGHRPEMPVEQIAACVGMRLSRFYKHMREHDWPNRQEAMKLAEREGPVEEPPRPPPPPAPVPAPLHVVADELAAGVRAELDRLGRGLGPRGGQSSPERVQALSALAKTLQVAQSIARESARASPDAAPAKEHSLDDGEPPPRSLDELRDELARHLDRIVAEERAAGCDDFLRIAGDRGDP